LLKARTKIHATTQTHLFLFSWHPIENMCSEDCQGWAQDAAQSCFTIPFHLAPVKWQPSYQVGRHSQSWPVKAPTESPALASELNLGRLPSHSHTCRAHPFRFPR
jgi:hypothetical protein